MNYFANLSSVRCRLASMVSIATFVAVFFSGYSFSQATVGVEPPANLFRVRPGERVDGVLTIRNPFDSPVNIRVYLADWEYSPEGTQLFLEPGSLPGSASDWITFSPSTLVLQGLESAVVRYTAEVPANVSPGTHWSMVFLEAEDPNPAPGDSFAAFTVRVGHTVYLNVPPIERDGLITGIFGMPPEDSMSPYEFAVQYVNTGNAAHILEGVIEFRDGMGETVVTMDLGQLVVLPGSTRILLPQLYGPLDPGPYTMLVVLNYGDRTRDVAGDFAFMLEQPIEAIAPPNPRDRDFGAESNP